MADPTPPSDIPDPASPTPATPQAGPAGTGGPKRIRSMPDRPASSRPGGTIRSMPDAATGATRGTGSYVDTLSTEKSWGRGLAILWALFLATLLMEMVNALCYVLSGKVGWPLPIDVARLALVCTFFVSLWAGIGWLRHLLATVDFVSGAWLLTDCVLSYRAAPKFRATGQADWTVYSSIESFPKIALGLLYLGTAFYLLFSDDVREFLVHRRTRGRIWATLVVTVLAYGGMLLVFAAQPLYATWMQGCFADAQRSGDETLRIISERWDPDSIFSRLDAAYAKAGLTKADREATFAAFKALGPLKSITPALVAPRAPLPQYPLQDKVPIPQGIDSRADASGTGFELTAKCAPAGVEFEHGKAQFGFDLVRDLSGPWRITKLNVENVQYDHPPAPAATPAPATDTTLAPTGTIPGPVTMPAPPGTASTAPTPARPTAPTVPPAAPSPAPPVAAPTPRTTPSAVASPTPAATPVPSTGG